MWRRSTVSVTVYDGAHRIGGNKIYLEDKGAGILLDFGKNFGKYGLFYEEMRMRLTAHLLVQMAEAYQLDDVI